MKFMRFAFVVAAAALASQAPAQVAVPQFRVDASWPKPLPNRWILGQVSGIATDRFDRIWVVHRPGSLTPRERAAEKNPPEAKCCVAAPPVLAFDRLQIFRKDGSFVSEHVFEAATRGTGSVYDMVFSPDREQRFIYMIDGMNGEVRIIDRVSKETLARFGRPGRQAGEFTALHNVAVDRQGNLYTSEVNTGQRIQKFRRVDRQE